MSGIDVSILWPALVAGLLVTATHVPLGMQVLARGIVFIDLAIAQIAGCGVILADRLGFDAAGASAQVAALLAAIAGALLLTWTERRWPDVQEAIIGVVFVLAATAGVLLLAGNVHGSEHLRDLLVGQILWVQPRQLLIAGAVYTAVLALWIGARARLGRTGFYLLFACVVTLSVQLVGLYLVFATLIVPPLATRHRVRRRLFQRIARRHGRLRQRHRIVGRTRRSDGAAHRLGAGRCGDHRVRSGAERQGCAGGGEVTRYSRDRESSHSVTGPSLTSATRMFAPNTPVCTGWPMRAASIRTNASKRG
jgi:zinc/manganese transport system permease protein